MGLAVFHEIFSDISHIPSKYMEYLGIFCGIVSIPLNIVVNMNDVMGTLHKNAWV